MYFRFETFHSYYSIPIVDDDMLEPAALSTECIQCTHSLPLLLLQNKIRSQFGNYYRR